MQKKTFDAVVSLGGICAPASQIRIRGMRPQALGLDWVGIREPSAIHKLCEAIRSEFKSVALLENMEYLEFKKDISGYHDRLTDLIFLHTFHIPNCGPGWYERDYGALRRRLDRLVKLCKSCKSIYFVYATDFEFDPAYGYELLDTLRSCYPQLEKIQLHINQFGSETGPYDVDLGSGDLEIFRYHRHRNFTYDILKTSYEWEFLDSIALANPRIRGNKTLNRLAFTCWKKLSKYLGNCGYSMNLDFLYA